MGGGLMQLVAYGAQDIYLTGNPQITFFKVVYRRHTNFSMECIEQTFNGSVTAAASSVTATISRNGDLISSMHLDIVFGTASNAAAGSTYTNWTNNTGHAFIDSVELEIGGQRIDKHYGHWLDIWNELTDHDQSEHLLLNKHPGKEAYLRRQTTAQGGLRLYVPLKFWFNRNPGLALPLIALQYHEVKVKLQTRGNAQLINHNGTATPTDVGNAPSALLWVDYIYLDTDERRRFAQQSHEPFESFKLQLNGHDRFSARRGTYFRTVQPLQAGHRVPEKHVYNYSFALKPEEHQPSGTCNFSRIDNARMIFTNSEDTNNNIHVYAVNYNVLRIMSGMGGLAYSN